MNAQACFFIYRYPEYNPSICRQYYNHILDSETQRICYGLCDWLFNGWTQFFAK